MAAILRNDLRCGTSGRILSAFRDCPNRRRVAMKLLTYDNGSGPRAGVLSGETVLDAASLLGESRPIRDVQALLELPNDPVNRLRLGFSMSAEGGVPLSSVKLRSPVLQPPTVRDF